MSREDTARINGDIVRGVYCALRDGTGGIHSAKMGLKVLMQPVEKNGQLIYPWQYWRMVDSSGVTIVDATRDPPATFREFIEAPPLRGLGERLEDIERLIADDDEAVVMLRELVVAGRGGDNGNRYTKKDDSSNADNISIAKDLFVDPEPAKKKADAGTSRAYALTRLKKERPDLFDRVCAKELSANAAAIEAGWRKKATAAEVLARVEPAKKKGAPKGSRNAAKDRAIKVDIINFNSSKPDESKGGTGRDYLAAPIW